MERYVKLEELGRGSYGVVWRAFDMHSYEYVAIKQLFRKYKSRHECLNLIEVQALMKNSHPNIVKLKRIFGENSTLHLVFEYMETDVYKLLKREFLCETVIRKMCFQVFQGLAYLHRNGYIHRDLKPANLLVNKDSVKIADLGMARDTNSNTPYDHNISTTLYRAPEVFLRSPKYDSAIDIWAMGAIMAELFTNQPLFRGFGKNPDVIRNICCLIGTPTKKTWLRGLQLADNMFYSFPQHRGVGIPAFLPEASSDAHHLISSLLAWDPSLRPTAEQTLQHPFFNSCYHVPRSIRVRYMSPNSVPPGFENKMHPKLINQTSSFNTRKGGTDTVDLEDLARFLPRNLLNF